LLTGGPVLAVSGNGAGSTVEGARLAEIRYEKLGRDLVISGYPRWEEKIAE